MSQPVWTLSVDLQTKTAAFTTGLADAAKGARQSFGDIRSSAGEMSGGVKGHMEGMDYSMTHARHGIHLMLEEMGIHMPRAVMSFLASLGPIGAAMEAAFPFLAIIVGVTLLIEHFHKLGEAEEKIAEAGRKLSDGFAERINKADQEIVKAEIEIRKLAGSPAWDLLNEKLRLEDAAKGLQNVAQLEKAVADLLKNAPTTTNWNPFNWFDGSGDVQAKAKALQEQMRGKSQSDQANIAQDALTLQSHILEQMKGQSGISEKQLEHQQKYVEFLKLETAELTRQADAAVLADQSQQGKDREDRIKKAEEEERKLSEARQRGLDHRQKVETEYAKKQKEIKAKAIEGSEHMQEMQKAAEDAFTEYQTKQML